jgi:hypothetical protein
MGSSILLRIRLEKGGALVDAGEAALFNHLKEGEAPAARTIVAAQGAMPVLHGAIAIMIEGGGAVITGLKGMEALKSCGPGNRRCIEMFCAALVLTCRGRPEYGLLAGLKDSGGVWSLAEVSAARVQFSVLISFFKEVGADGICANGL